MTSGGYYILVVSLALLPFSVMLIKFGLFLIGFSLFFSQLGLYCILSCFLIHTSLQSVLIIKHELFFPSLRIVDMDVNRGVIEVRNPKSSSTEPKKTFTFDSVYDWK